MHAFFLPQAIGDDHDDDQTSGSITPDASSALGHAHAHAHAHHAHAHNAVHVKTSKVCVQRLALPEGVEVIHAVPAVGHLSSASIYPACLAPYVMVTACSDQKIR